MLSRIQTLTEGRIPPHPNSDDLVRSGNPDRAFLSSPTATHHAVGLYAWTPRQGIGAGRSCFDGTVFVTNVNARLHNEYVRNAKGTVALSGNSRIGARERKASITGLPRANGWTFE